MGWPVAKSYAPHSDGTYHYEAIAYQVLTWHRHLIERELSKSQKKVHLSALCKRLGVEELPAGVTAEMGDDPTVPVKSITLVGPFSLKLAARLIGVPGIINPGEKRR